MECVVCNKRRAKQQLASKNYYIRNSEKIITKNLTRRYLKRKQKDVQSREDRSDSGEGDTSDSGEGDTSDSGEGNTGDSGKGGSDRETEKKK